MKYVLICSIIWLFSCSRINKDLHDRRYFHPIEATWDTWVGGLPGVGGNSYELILEIPHDKKFKVLALEVDGNKIPFSVQKENENRVIVRAIENLSVIAEESIEEQRPKFRVENPSDATLTFIFGRDTTYHVIKHFKKAK